MSAAIITIRQKRLIRAFRAAGATDRSRAVPLQQLGQQQTWIFDKLVQAGVFVAAEADRYYLDERAADAFWAAYRRQALVFAGIFLLVFIVVWLLGRSK